MNEWSTLETSGSRAPLTRSAQPDIAGVAGGIGHFIGINPNIIRALFAVLALAGGAGFLAYIGLWLLLPGPDSKPGEPRAPQGLAAGGALLVLAALVGLLSLGGIGQPANLIVLGVLFAGVTILNRQPDGLAARTSGGSVSGVGSPFSSIPAPLPFQEQDPFLETLPYPEVGLELSPDPTVEMNTAVTNTEVTNTEVMMPNWPPPDVELPQEPTSELEELEQSEESEPTSEMDESEAAGSDEPTDEPDAPAPVSENRIPDPTVAQPMVSPPSTPSGPAPTADPADADRWEKTQAAAAPKLRVGSSAGVMPTMDQVQRTHWAVTKMADETVDSVARPSAPPGPPLGLIALASLAAVLGVALVLNTLAEIFVGATTVIGAGMAIVGLLITIGSFRGRVLPLIPLAVGLLILLPASPIIDHAITDGIGSSDITVSSVDDLLPVYEVGVGGLTLDLSQLEITEDTVVSAEVGTGSLTVTVPRETAVLASGETTIGSLWMLGEGRGGIGNDLRVRPNSSHSEDAPRLILDLKTTIGSIDVYRDWNPGDEPPLQELLPLDDFRPLDEAELPQVDRPEPVPPSFQDLDEQDEG